jgi:hypothetical protein
MEKEDNFKNLLIEIYVPTNASPHTGRIGTGYPIAKDRILTARHVLFPKGQDPDAEFQIRWHHWRNLNKSAGRWHKVSRDQIIWPGTEALDAAVIAFPFPEEVNAWRGLSARNPATDTPWESEGFPAVGRRNDKTRVAVPMRGMLYKRADRAPDWWLDVAGKPEVEENWAGASGSPVFVLSRVVGIISKVPPGFAGGRLLAVPASRLLEEPAFCTAIGYRPSTDRHARLVQVLQSTRDVSPVAIGALECCVSGDPAGGLWRDPVSPVDELAWELGRYDVARMMQHARQAIRALKDGHPEDAQALSALVQRLLPLLYDHTAVEAVREKVDDTRAILIGFPVATRFVAEVVMAGTDQRETRYRPPQANQELEGQFSLPLTPNSGIDPTGERRLEDFREHLRRKLAVTRLSSFEGAFYRCMREFIPESLRERLGEQDPVVKQMAAAKVRDLAEYESSRHYYLFQLPKDHDERASCLGTLKKLKQEFPAIAFLELADDPELMRGEWEDFLPLEHILTVTQE